MLPAENEVPHAMITTQRQVSRALDSETRRNVVCPTRGDTGSVERLRAVEKVVTFQQYATDTTGSAA